MAHYAEFYDLRHVLILGRVTSGEGGRIVQAGAEKVLKEEFPELAIGLHLPEEEAERRVGQAIAAGKPAGDRKEGGMKMRFSNPSAEIFVPDARSIEEALGRTTHLAVAAHQDDVEIMAFHGILECFGREDRGFAAVVVTDGRGSPRDGIYADYTDEQMREVRRREQKKAAVVGEYAALVLLDHPSGIVKDPAAREPLEDLKEVFMATAPRIVYTHNLADKHDTHVAVAIRTIRALRELPPEKRPEKVLGCEVWRDLDWMPDEDKVALRVDGRDNLAAALLGVFDSQICGGKRYDLATLGRRRAHATYHATHGVDEVEGLTLAMDLTPLIRAPEESIRGYVVSFIQRFAAEVEERLRRLDVE